MSDRPALNLAAPFVIAIPLVASSSTAIDAVLLNQLLAVALFGALVLWAALAGPVRLGLSGPNSAMAPVSAVLLASLVLAVNMLASRGRSDVWPLDVAVLGAAAAVLLAAVAHARAANMSTAESAHALPLAMAWGWWGGGVLCVLIAGLQYFAPGWSWAEGLVASSGSIGRAVGNMRQPNHLATALLCAMVMTAALWQARNLAAWAAGASLVAMVAAVALSASRTGALSLGVLLLWAVLDRRLPRACRWLLAATPLIYGLCWWALAQWAQWQDASFYGAERLQQAGDPSSSRFAVWSNTLALIAQHPWAGVGWGQFNFAWTFTAFPGRPVAFFDHSHNLPLQLAVEIGLPATAAVLGLLGWALWRSRSGWRARGPAADGARAALVMLVVLGVHSLLEYPLWYAYFLLPAAWALGMVLGAVPAVAAGRSELATEPGRAGTLGLALAGAAMLAGAGYVAWDHGRVERIFSAKPGLAALDERITEGRRSRLFGHHADYAAVTHEPRDVALASFRRPLLQLVDVRLLVAYIEALKAAGDDRRALYAAQRLREFRRPDAQEYFKDCGGAEPPFQCEREPVTGLGWRDMLPP